MKNVDGKKYDLVVSEDIKIKDFIDELLLKYDIHDIVTIGIVIKTEKHEWLESIIDKPLVEYMTYSG